MKKLAVYCATAVGAVAVAMGFLATATAHADDYAGQTYGDASGAISDADKKAVISSRSGDAPSNDQCLVTHSQSAPWLKGAHFTPDTKTVLLDLNCNAKVASAKKSASKK